MTTTIATTQNGRAAPLTVNPWDSAKAFVASGMFPTVKSEAEAYVKILAGQELGIGPMASMMGIDIIKGKVSYSANLLAAQVKNHPRYDFRPIEISATRCELQFWEEGIEAGNSEFTLEDAQRAGLVSNGGMYSKYPKAMLFARALTQGIRWYCADVTAGTPAYVPEELGANVNGDGEVVAQVEQAPQEALPAPEPAAPPESLLKLKALMEKYDFSEEMTAAVKNWIKSDSGKADLDAVDEAVRLLEKEDVPALLRKAGLE